MIVQDSVAAALRAHYARREKIVRSLLEQWVSESEPAIVESSEAGDIIGLARAEDPTCTIVVWATGHAFRYALLRLLTERTAGPNAPTSLDRYSTEGLA